MKTIHNCKHMRRLRGAALVEFAIVSVLLFTLIFGIMEGGLVVNDQNMITSSARVTSRALAAGDMTTVAESRGISTTTFGATDTKYANSVYTYPCQTAGSCTAAPPAPPGTGWTALTDSTTTNMNNAQSGDYVCSIVTYKYPLPTNFVFGGGTLALSSTVVDRRQ